MLLSLIYTELIKYKRTAVIWMILIGGFLTAGTAYLMVSSNNSEANWQIYSAAAFNCVNTLALLLSAVFTGYVVMGEYHGSTISTIFSYPVSKLKLLLIKFFIILLMVIALYMVFLISTLLFGILNIGEIPSTEFLIKLIKLSLLMAVVNYVLAPVTAIISLLIKGTATYLFVGMGYFITYVSFINSEYSYLIPTNIPNKLIEHYFVSNFLSKTDFAYLSAVSAVFFFLAVISASVYYLKSDCR